MAKWFDGTLKNVDNITNDKLKTKYLVRYDLDRNKEREMPLFIDLKRGDLVLL